MLLYGYIEPYNNKEESLNFDKKGDKSLDVLQKTMSDIYIFSDRKKAKNLPVKLLIVTILPAFFVIAIYSIANASFSSFMKSVLGGDQASAKVLPAVIVPNSQTIAILQPALNTDPNPEKSEEIIPIVSGETLVADLASVNSTSTENIGTQISTYIVQKGDTISSVAKMFNVSSNTILWANDISNRTGLKEGQILVILPISGIVHTVKNGDTILAIAKKYNTDIDDILNYNDITLSTKLTVGQTILVPDGEFSNTNPKPASSSTSSGGLTSYPGYYIRPIADGVGYKSQKIHGHNGVDLAAPVGTPIRASAAGKVIISRSGGWNGGYGTFVVISHKNGTQTLYAHMLKTVVSVGDTVSQGQYIGNIGMTGKTTGPHIHFEIRGAKNPF
jgi:LysM repeat protein